VLAEKSSDSERKILVRNVCQLSPGSADRSELMLCVAMIGMHFGWRKTEELLVAGRVAFAHGGEVLVLVAKEKNLPEIQLGGEPRFSERD